MQNLFMGKFKQKLLHNPRQVTISVHVVEVQVYINMYSRHGNTKIGVEKVLTGFKQGSS